MTDPFTAVNFVGQLLAITGHWPKKNPRFVYELKNCISFASALIFVVVNLVDIALHFENFQILAQNLSVTAPVMAVGFKLLVVRTHRKEYFVMVDLMKKLPAPPEDLDFHIKRMVKGCVLLTKGYGGICAVVVTLYGTTALMTESKLPIPLSFNFGPWLYGVYTFQMLAIMNAATNTVCVDMLAACFMGIAICHLDILKEKIGRVLETKNPDDKESERTERLEELVSHHCQIIRYVGSIEGVFSLVVLTQYLSSILSICNIGFQLAHIHPKSPEFANMLFYFSSMMTQLATYCWFGNEIVLKSQAIGDACYDFNWISHSNTLKKSLIIIMGRSRKPLAISAGKFSRLSFASLTSIMNASYSYFTLMQRLYKKNKI